MNKIKDAFSQLSNIERESAINDFALKAKVDKETPGLKAFNDAVAAEKPSDVIVIETAEDISLAIKMMANFAFAKKQGKQNAKNEEEGQILAVKPVKEMFDEEGFNWIMSNQGLEPYIVHASSRSTHIPKFGNNYAESINIISTLSDKAYGVTQADAPFGRLFYAHGSANYMAYQHVMGLVVSVEGKTTSFLDLLLEGNELLKDGLVALGVNEDQFGAYVQIAKEQSNSMSLATPPQEQILWPEVCEESGDLKFTSLSPMPSAKMYASLRTLRVEVANENPWHYLRSASLSCGGGNPQNIGGMPAKYAGKMPGLLAKTPFIKNPSTLMERVERGYRLLKYKIPEGEPLKKPITHFKQRNGYRYFCREYAAAVLVPVLEYREILAEQESPVYPKNSIEKELLTSDFKGGKPEEIAGKIYVEAVGHLNDDKKGFDEEQASYIKSEIATFIRQFMKES